jgi:hypothetical protein
MDCEGKTLSMELKRDMRSVNYVGYFTNDALTDFSAIEVSTE